MRAHRDGLVFSIYLSVVSTLVSLLLALPVSLALQAGLPGKRLFRTLYELPLIVPTEAMAWKAVTFITLIIAGPLTAVPADLRHAARTLGARR